MANPPLIHQSGERLFVTSLDISNRFGKQHKDVLRSIDNLDCSPEFGQRNFAPVEYRDAKGEMRRMFEITRDGFTFLCMGFTGHQAAVWKERYIAAFNDMERMLLNPVKRGRKTGMDLSSDEMTRLRTEIDREYQKKLRGDPVSDEFASLIGALSTAVSIAPPAALPSVAASLKMTRQKERIALEMFVAGHDIAAIGKHLGVSRTTASLVLHGKYQFGPGAGLPECSPALIAAVAARHLAVEQARLAQMQERAAQRYLCSANNQALAVALDAVGRHLQQAPALALAAPKGGA